MTEDPGILRLVDGFTAALERHDAHAFAELFTEDADFTNVAGAGARGRESVERFHAPIFAGRFRNVRTVSELVSVRRLTEDLASVDVRWTMTGARDSSGKERAPRHGLLNWIVKKEGQDWRILVMHNSEFPPPV